MADRDHTQADPDRDALIEEASAWFARLRSEPVSRADHRAFAAWLDMDPEHRRAYAEVEALWRELGELPDPRQALPPVPRPSRRPRLVAAAALLLAAVVAAPWLAPGIAGLAADHATAVGETGLVMLDDGSTLHLNTRTAVDVDYGPRKRRLTLHRGEVWLAVVPDAGRPFEVTAGEVTLRVLGTAFNVRAAGGAVSVAVAEGRVALEHPGGVMAAPLTLEAGEGARYADGRVAPAVVDPGAVAGWRDGRLVFTDHSLAEVVAEIDRYRRGVTVVAGDGLAGLRFSGALDVREPDRALVAIAQVLPLEVVRLGPYLTLIRPHP